MLRFAGTFNLLAGLSMLVLYHEGLRLFEIEKPKFILPVQLVGVLVGLFGVGYHMVASDPLRNRNLLVLGFWSKALGSALAAWHVLLGKLPAQFLLAVFFADVIYLPPFWIILRRLAQAQRQPRAD